MPLPPGLALNSRTGVISGVPTTPGVYSFTLRVRDSQGLLRDIPSSITVSAYTPPSLSGVLPTFANRNTAYTGGFTRAGGTAPFSWSISAGVLPTGMTISPTTGAISGTPTDTNYVDRDITVRVQDSVGSFAQRSQTIRYADILSLTGSLVAGVQKTPYSDGFDRIGGHSPFTYSIVAGSLPSGLTLNASTGIISGTPAGVSSNAIIIRVVDAAGASAERSQTLAINSAYTPLSFSGSITGGSQSVQTLSAFSITPNYAGVTLSGGNTPVTYSWARIGGSSAIAAGSPSSFGTSFVGNVAPGSTESATFRCTASDGTSSATIDVAISVTNVYTQVGISISLGLATRLFSYSATPSTTGGASPFTYAIASGTLPAGLSINSSTGVISGTPSDTSYTDRPITVRVTDALGGQANASSTMVYRNAPGFSYSLPAAMRTRGYSASPSITPGGHGFGSMAITSGSLPSGLSLASGTGAISGTPADTSYVTRTLAFQFTDTAGNVASQAGVSLPYADNILIAGTLPAGTQNAPYSSSALSAIGGHGGNVWSITSGAMPPGLSLNTSTGAVTGTPSTVGSFAFAVRVTDAQGFTADSGQSIAVAAGVSVSVSPTTADATHTNVPPSFTPSTRGMTTNIVTATPAGGTSPYTASWERVSGAVGITATNPSAPSTQFTGIVGVDNTLHATFRVTVTDAAMNTATADVNVTLSYQSGF